MVFTSSVRKVLKKVIAEVNIHQENRKSSQFLKNVHTAKPISCLNFVIASQCGDTSLMHIIKFFRRYLHDSLLDVWIMARIPTSATDLYYHLTMLMVK